MRRYVVQWGLRVMKKIGILSHVNFTISSLEDSGISVPMIGSIGYEHFFENELWLNNLLKKLIPVYCNTDYFIDVGVNTGQTLLKVKLINREADYLGFEPNPNCLFYLYHLIRYNRFENVTILPYALSNVSGMIDLNFHSASTTDSLASIVPNFRQGSFNRIKVPLINGDDLSFLENCKHGIIKIDVEGGELEAIKGLDRVIQRDRPIIICEVLPVYSVENTQRLKRQHELESMLRDFSYCISLIDHVGSLEEIDSIGIHSDLNRVNYLFCPVEGKNELDQLVNLV